MGDGSSSGSAASPDVETEKPSADHGTLAGEIVAGHELVRRLAAGGMGEVYLAKQQASGVLRAVKVIRADLRRRYRSLERFHREVQVLARLRHDSIVQLIEFGTLDNGWPFLAMEYIDGPSLEQLLEQGPLSIQSALIVLEQMALALHHAHSNSIIHRDLKPSNILMRSADVHQVKIIDFGLARILDGDGERLTGPDEMIGSPTYMAPEQAEGAHDVTPAADVYTLGAIAYKLVSGSPPFALSKHMRLMLAHTHDVPPRLSQRCPEIPAPVDELLYRCLAKDPAIRPRAEEVAATLGAHVCRDAPASHATPAAQVTPAESAMPAAPGGPRIELVASPWGDRGLRDIASQLLDRPVPRDPDGLGVALATEIMSLTEEIATYLSISDPELTSLLRFEARICEQLAGLERDLALAHVQLQASPGDSDLVQQRDELLERVRTLNAQQLPLQRRLVEIVEAYRPFATGVMEVLFRQMDRALQELERLRREFP